jgi:hypothetical protein
MRVLKRHPLSREQPVRGAMRIPVGDVRRERAAAWLLTARPCFEG